MIKVNVTKQSSYPVSSPMIKKTLRSFFEEHGIVSDAEVTVALVGKDKMMALAEKHLRERGVIHDILSFPGQETKRGFVYPPGGKIQLGEIVVCYPKVFDEAKKENKLISQKLLELVEHGAAHLMGEHHD